MYLTPPIQPPLHPWTIGTSTSSLMTRQNQSFHTTGGGGTRRWSWGLDTTNRVGWRRTYFEAKESGLENQDPLYAAWTPSLWHPFPPALTHLVGASHVVSQRLSRRGKHLLQVIGLLQGHLNRSGRATRMAHDAAASKHRPPVTWARGH
jgi:hypothetical protein